MSDAPDRRGSDVRLVIVEERLREVLDTVKGIDQALRFPENSPLGRQLIERADRNAKNIDVLRVDVDTLEQRFDEMTGVVKALRLVSLLIGIALGIFGLIQLVHP